MISLFDPIYPKLEEIKEIINSNREAVSLQIKPVFWLARILDHPQTAHDLLEICMPLQAEKNKMTRGIPEHILVTLDGMLTNRYKEMEAKVTIPPLSLALNNQQTSTTKRRAIQNFKS